MAENAKSKDGIKLALYLVLLAIGIVLLLVPQTGMEIIIVILAIAMLAYGVISIIMTIVKKKKGVEAAALPLPIVLLVLGVLLIIFRVDAAAKLFPIIIGAWAIVAGIISLIHAVQVKKFGSSAWILLLITALIVLVLGLIIIIGIFTGANIVGVMLGIYLTIFAIVSVVDWIATASAKKKSMIQ
ncbi:MAG: DUF308 domain-containing protein [Christensenellaceae bacterium]